MDIYNSVILAILGTSAALNIIIFIWSRELSSSKNHLLVENRQNLERLKKKHFECEQKSKKILDLEAELLKERKKKESRSQSVELKEFLTDLLSGESLIAVSRVDSNNLFTVSPKDSR